MSVATISPGFAVLLDDAVDNDDKCPVGPPIWTLLPPNREMMNPAMIAVIIPFSGDTPEAIPKAMANGNATIPTMYLPSSRP